MLVSDIVTLSPLVCTALLSETYILDGVSLSLYSSDKAVPSAIFTFDAVKVFSPEIVCAVFVVT